MSRNTFKLSIIVFIFSFGCKSKAPTKEIATPGPAAATIQKMDSVLTKLTLGADSLSVNGKINSIIPTDGEIEQILDSIVARRVLLILRKDYDRACFTRLTNYFEKKKIDVLVNTTY